VQVRLAGRRGATILEAAVRVQLQSGGLRPAPSSWDAWDDVLPVASADVYPERLDAAAEKLVDPEPDVQVQDGSQWADPASPAAPCTPGAGQSVGRSFSVLELVAGPMPRVAEPDSRPGLAEVPGALSAAAHWVLLYSSAAAEPRGSSPLDAEALSALLQPEPAAEQPEQPAERVVAAVLQHWLV